MPDRPKIVLGVPGKWMDRTDLSNSISSSSGGYQLAGMFLFHEKSESTVTLELYEHDPNLLRAFEKAGAGNFSETELQSIDQHTHTVYLIAEGGSLCAAKSIMRAASALLLCGGEAVKVESSGLAHSVKRWRQLAGDGSPEAISNAFVVLLSDEGSYYSCGMHNLGYEDVAISADISIVEANELMRVFLLYTILEDPTLCDGHTFSVEADAPQYVIKKIQCTEFPEDDLFHNQYGLWLLSPV